MGRFLSADPVVNNSAGTQAFNRYSYCFNNPLMFTDPSGMTPPYIWRPLPQQGGGGMIFYDSGFDWDRFIYGGGGGSFLQDYMAVGD